MNILKRIVRGQKQAVPVGIYAVCSANFLVIEAALRQCAALKSPLLIEATANQVGPEGGYTGLTPRAFKHKVLQLANQVGLDEAAIVFGGDHLGPLTYRHLEEEDAMARAGELVAAFVDAGFTKIHLDASMPLKGESAVDVETVARRTAELAAVCEEACRRYAETTGREHALCYVVGSEVPTPGGATEGGTELAVTTPRDFETTVEVTRAAFKARGIESAFEKVIGVVVQPGVEFGQYEVTPYDRVQAQPLKEAIKAYPQFVFEGHSTDYQSPAALAKLVQDGVAILKVGPALTFALREALFALEAIESELIRERHLQSHLTHVIKKIMQEEPTHWSRHYTGSDVEIAVAQKFSYSDRIRYYLAHPQVEQAVNKLFYNIDRHSARIPMPIFSQYMPLEYAKIKAGAIPIRARELVMAHVQTYLAPYVEASQLHLLNEIKVYTDEVV